MFRRLGHFLVRRRRLILVATVMLLPVFGYLGGSAVPQLSSGGQDDPGSESSLAARALHDEFDAGDPNLVLLVSADDPVDDPAVAAAGARLADRLAGEDHVTQVTSYWTAGQPPDLRSNDRRSALVVANIEGSVDQVVDRFDAFAPEYAGAVGILDVRVGGGVAVRADINETVERDLIRSEIFVQPLLFAILILVFGSVVSAAVPVIVSAPIILGSLCMLWVMAQFTDVSIFALNLATSMGMGLAIDYSLFILTRYREELAARGRSAADRRVVAVALAASLRTAGRTVLFSALTVAICLSALLVFPLYFLRSMALASIFCALFAAVAALVLLPALLAALGPRIDRLDARPALRRVFRRPARGPQSLESGFWHRLATFVMRRPFPVLTAAAAVLILLGWPFLRAEWGLPDERALPESAPSRQVSDILREDFSASPDDAISLVALGIGDPEGQTAAVGRYAARVSRVDGVERVDSLAGSYADGRQVAPPGPQHARFGSDDSTWLQVSSGVDPQSGAGGQLVDDLRGGGSPWPVQVAGSAAELVDTKQALADGLPLALGIMVAGTFVLLFLFTGSVVLPVKAIILNVLSLTASFGALVWVFQDGHLTFLLGDPTVTGWLVATMPVLMLCIAFALSMDYELFMLSRITEEYARTGETESAVAFGLERTGRLVTAAAVTLAVVFAALGVAEVAFMKMLGLGLALAVVLDATVVRGLLLPALMRVAGRFNWWAPGPLRRLHARIGLQEGDRRPARSPARPAAADPSTAAPQEGTPPGKQPPGKQPVGVR